MPDIELPISATGETSHSDPPDFISDDVDSCPGTRWTVQLTILLQSKPHQCAQPCKHKLLNFQTYVYSATPDIIGVTETWLNDSILNNEILPYDYSIFRKDRNSRGGGVLLAIHISIPTKLIPSPPNLEIIVVELIHVKCIVCSVYSPTVNLTTFTDTLSFLSNLASVQNVLIIGDFNLPDLIGPHSLAVLLCQTYSVILFSIITYPN